MKKLSSLLLCALLTSCASIVGSSSENITISSNVDDVKITVMNSDNVPVYAATLPTSVKLKKKEAFFAGETYSITAEKPGYVKQMRTVDTSISGWYWGNILFGGLIGMLIVDPATGSMWTFDDDTIHIPMLKQ